MSNFWKVPVPNQVALRYWRRFKTILLRRYWRYQPSDVHDMITKRMRLRNAGRRVRRMMR